MSKFGSEHMRSVRNKNNSLSKSDYFSDTSSEEIKEDSVQGTKLDSNGNVT